jgi:hypothetical protein
MNQRGPARNLKIFLGLVFALAAVLIIREAPREIQRAYALGTVPSYLLLLSVGLFLSIVPSFLLFRSAFKALTTASPPSPSSQSGKD